jgi:transposase
LYRSPNLPVRPRIPSTPSSTDKAESDRDGFVERLCAPYYKEGGRPSIPPGTYFRMLFIGYFEGIDSQRGIAWRCADNRSLWEFLGADLTEATPAHDSMTVIRQRLPEPVFDQVFAHVLRVLEGKGLLKARTPEIDATTLEANAALRSIVRKADGKDGMEFLRAVAKAEGVAEPTDDCRGKAWLSESGRWTWQPHLPQRPPRHPIDCAVTRLQSTSPGARASSASLTSLRVGKNARSACPRARNGSSPSIPSAARSRW